MNSPRPGFLAVTSPFGLALTVGVIVFSIEMMVMFALPFFVSGGWIADMVDAVATGTLTLAAVLPFTLHFRRKARDAGLALAITNEGYWEVGRDGRILDVNDGYCQLSGYSRAEVLAMKIADFEAVESSEEVKAHSERIATIGHDRFETRHRHRDGRLLEIEVSASLAPETGHFIAFLRDITDRKQAERQLEKAHRNLETLTEALPDAVYFKDGDSHWLIVNSQGAQAFGLQREDWLGKTDLEIGKEHPPLAPSMTACYESDQQAWRAGHRIDSSELVNGPDGQVHHYAITKVPLFRDNGERDGLVVIGRDVTAIKASEAELNLHRLHLEALVEQRTAELVKAMETAERANRAKSTFLDNMSHELRTPMHSILSFGRLGLENTTATDSAQPKLHQYFDRIVQSGDRLLIMLNDLLDLSKLEAGKMVLQVGEHHLHDLVQEAVSEVGVLAEKKDIAIDTDSLPTYLTLECDAARIGQVLRNLLSNAIKFSPSHSTIHLSAAPASISWRRAKDHSRAGMVVKVCDQGVGVPETELESIFDKFVQSSKTRTGAGGTGLGLAICREIVEAHHGRIYAENCPDGGTCLVCMLPLKQHYVEAESSV